MTIPYRDVRIRITYKQGFSEIPLDEVPKSICWLDFYTLVISSKVGYTCVDIKQKTSNLIEISDRATNPSIVSFSKNNSVIW